jgi:hypothetical protein
MITSFSFNVTKPKLYNRLRMFLNHKKLNLILGFAYRNSCSF